MKTSRTRFIAAVAALSLSAIGCGAASAQGPAAGGWDAVVAAAKSERELTVYSGHPPVTNQALVAAFNKDNPGITLTILNIPSAEQKPRLEAEQAGKTAGADAVLNSDGGFIMDKATNGGNFFAEIIGPEATGGAGAKQKLLAGRNRALTITATPQGFSWNKNLIQANVTFDDIVSNPAYRGKVGVLDFKISDVFTIQLKEYADVHGGDAWLKKLAAQKPLYYSTAVPMAQALAAGEATVTLQMTENSIGTLPLGLVYPKPTFASPYYVSIAGTARHPNAAQVFANWLLTKSAQEAYVSLGLVSMAGIVPTAKVQAGDVKLVLLQEYDQKTITEYRAHLSEIFQH